VNAARSSIVEARSSISKREKPLVVRSRSGLFALCLALSLSLGCAKTQHVDPVVPVSTSDAPAILVEPANFARQAHALLLSEERNQETKLRLAGIVQYQLTRADQLFKDGHVIEAEDMVTGALLLLRHDDELISATRGQESALFQAAHAAARSGDAGRAGALYELTLNVAQDPRVVAEAKDHLAALRSWNEETDGKTALSKAGETTRRALARAIVSPKAEAYLDARDSIIKWMHTALTSSTMEQAPESSAEREQALEAYRAIRTGAPALVALCLRQGSPEAALAALEEANLDRALPPGLASLIEDAEKKQQPEAWLELFRQLESLREEEGTETSLPRYVLDAAAFWSAIKLYRAAPGKLEHAMPLAMTLVEFGMPSVASSLLSQNADKKSDRQAVAWSLSLVLRGLLELSRTDQLHDARRSYSEASKLLKLADEMPGGGPGSAEAESLMAALESRHGFVDRALPLLESSVRRVPSAEALLRLAQLQAQNDQLKKAEQSIVTAIDLAQKDGNLLLEARAEEALFRAHREAGDHTKAEAALGRALSRTLVLRKMEVSTFDTATVERQLARLLEYYGKTREMRQAYLRALAASRSSALELEITLTDMSRAALTTGDLSLGRSATPSALDFGLPPENSIYIALWQQLLEKRMGTQADGVSREVLMRAGKASGWLDTLRRFGLGEIEAETLEKAAEGIPEKAEATFYKTLDLGNSNVQKSALLPIAESAAVDLIEVRIAQDLLQTEHTYALPEGVEIP
jgi:tetratricopeptide (TPR) repeat protein